MDINDVIRLKKYYSNNTSDDTLFVENLFKNDQIQEPLRAILEQQFMEINNDSFTEKKNLDHIFYKLYFDITSKEEQSKINIKTIIGWSYRIAGIILIPILILLSYNLFQKNSKIKDYVIEIKAPAWTRTKFCLPDGTKGYLNSNSALSYTGNYIDNRQIKLSGEAYFEVVKNPKNPFVVNSKNVQIKVLGTKFNIATYENEKNVEVVLEEGKLVFKGSNQTQTYTMKPNELLIYDKLIKNIKVENVNSSKFTSWKDGKLIFRNDPVDVVIRRLERWYNVSIINKIPGNEDIRWRATFVDEDIEKILDLMQRTLPINYTIEYPRINSKGVYLKKKIIITLKN